MLNIKKIFVLILTLVLLVSCTSSAFAITKSDYVEGEVLVVLRNTSSTKLTLSTQNISKICMAQASAVAGKVGSKALSTYNSLSAQSCNIFAHIKSDTKTTDELIRELSNNPAVIAVSKNYIRKISSVTPNDANWSSQWGVKKINAPKAWERTKGSQDVVAAVIDSGVIYDHEDLAANMWKNSDGVYGKMFHGNGSSDIITGIDGTSGAALDDWSRVGDINGHGTHVAGIIGAVGNNNIGVAGVNWNTKILTVGVFSLKEGNITAFDADIIAGLDYITSLKNNGVNIRVANMSLGGLDPSGSFPDEGPLGIAVKTASEAGSNGILICMSVGNSGYNLDYVDEKFDQRIFPSSFKFANTLAVGSTASDDVASDFSNFSPSGKWVDVFAPGTDIMSTCRKTALSEYSGDYQVVNSSGYKPISGTSMATPMVTGSAALLCAAYPSKNATQIKELLTSTATNVCKGGFSKYGQIDLGAAMEAGDRRVQSIVLSVADDNRVLAIGQTKQVSAAVSPVDATNKMLSWKSSNANVATVNQNGLVSAIAGGSATITATAKDGSGVTGNISFEVQPQSGGSGGGCNAGLGVLAIMALIPVLLKRKRK